jgi:hypothetical protein
MIEHIREYCPHIYDDPHDGRDMCSRLGCHCVAADSPYSQAERGESICKVFNSFTAMPGAVGKRECTRCHASFHPTSNHQHYCPQCARILQRDKARKRKQMSRFRASETIDLQGFADTGLHGAVG